MKEEPLLRPEEVSGVLSGGEGGEEPAEPTGDGEAKPYSLREPLAIPPNAEAAARGKIEQLAEALCDVMKTELGELDFDVDGLQQQRAGAALSAIPPPAWVLSLARSGGGGVALALPSVLALALVELALGGPGKVPESGREPTPLESRVLTRMIGSASARLAEVLGSPMSPLDLEIGKTPQAVATSGETMGVGLVRIRLGDGEHSSLLLVTASLLLPSAEAATHPRQGVGPLASRLERIPIEIRPVLKAGRVSLSDLMKLEQGKVLRLDASEDSPIELWVAERPLFLGRIVRQDEQPIFSVLRRRGRRSREGGKDHE